MFLNKKTVLVLATSISITSLKAQYSDSSSNKSTADAVKRNFSLNTATQRNGIRPRSFIVPAFMIAYGATTLASGGMQSINKKVKDEVWVSKPDRPTRIDNYLLAAPAVAVYGLNLAGIKGKHNLRDRSMLLALSAGITNATVFTVKSLSNEVRPDGSDNYSFPSGHTAQAFASAEFLRQEYKDVSPWYGVAGYMTATATGMLRMYKNKHWLSDVVAGAGVGIASTRLAYLIYPAIKRKLFKDKPVRAVVTPYYQPGNGGSAGLSMVYSFH